jgi:hypothetical protein
VAEVQAYFADRDKLQKDTMSKVHGNAKTDKVR